ncbi:PAS domain S-box protein [Clostridium bovifaecis]|uniref:histidine kinase n=1 Tax=Clostridium bovifaecis TaxID=2184719 RepID=A0A6I6EVN4_9CLOT|nr:PAS domain S-box protein [Clostridium bovifaecis]
MISETDDFSSKSSASIDQMYKFMSDIGIDNILNHYRSKIDLGTFLHTIKCYRHAYIDTIISSNILYKEKLNYSYLLERVFDNLEIFSCSQWNKTSNSEIKFNTLSEITSALIFMHDFDKLIYVNSAVEQITGYTKDEALEIGFINMIHPSYLDEFKNYLLNKDITSCSSPTFEVKLVTKNNIEKWLEFNQGYIHFGDRPLILGIAFDVSNRKKVEEENKKLHQAMEYDKLKTEFFTNLSHEFRTPLNVIMSSIQLLDILAPTNTSSSFKKYISIMKQNGYRLTRLINNLLDITSIECGHINAHFEHCDIVSYIEDIVLSSVKYAKNKDITIVFDTDIEEKIIVFDKDKVARIILNLISNSIKFTDQGGYIYINIYTKENSVTISVKDTGIGIPEEKHSIIFNNFIKVDRSLSRRQEGSGIGLALVKSLVEVHKGKLYLRSKSGRGCEVAIEIPANLEPTISSTDSIHCHIGNSYIETVQVELSDIY